MKKFLIKFIALLFLFSAVLYASNPEVRLNAVLKKVSGGSYALEYELYLNGIDSSDFLEERILYPCGDLVIEGQVIDNKINERDFLYSERDIDLNNDGDMLDSFLFKYKGNDIFIADKKSSPLFRTFADNIFFVPYSSQNVKNLIQLSVNAVPIIIERFNFALNRITVNTSLVDREIFKEFDNSLLIIEVIQKDYVTKNPVLDGKEMKAGYTNERVFNQGGENLKRHVYMTNVELKENSSSGKFVISNIEDNFIVRVRYLFAISNKVIMVKEKIINSYSR